MTIEQMAYEYADKSCFDDPEFTATKLAYEAGANYVLDEIENFLLAESIDFYNQRTIIGARNIVLNHLKELKGE